METCSRREWWLHQALYRKVKKEKYFKAVGLFIICWLVGLTVSMLPKSSQAFSGRKQRIVEKATWTASTGFIELYQDQHRRVMRNLCCRFHASKIQSCDMPSVKVAWNPQGITPAELKPQNRSGLTNWHLVWTHNLRQTWLFCTEAPKIIFQRSRSYFRLSFQSLGHQLTWSITIPRMS